MKKFLCIAGKGDLAVDLLTYMVEHYNRDDKEWIGVLCNKTETGENGFQKSLRWFANRYGVKEYELEELYKKENLIFISLEYDRLIRPSLFKSSSLYNVHFSMLPKYKGMFTSAFPILNGESKSGVTLHRIDAGIDTGDIIDQTEFGIEGMTCRELYFKYTRYGSELILKNINKLLEGTVFTRKQPEHYSTYYSKEAIDYTNVKIDLNQTADEVCRQIRAYSFREYQMPVVFEKTMISAEITNIRSKKKPGTILTESNSGVMIATVDYNVILYYDRLDELINACGVGDIEKVHSICSVKKHINDCDEHGWTPLIVATYHNQIEIAKWMILMGANIYATNHNGTTLLMYAKEVFKNTGQRTLFDMYLSLGLDIEQRDYYGNSVIDYISKEGLRELLEVNHGN